MQKKKKLFKKKRKEKRVVNKLRKSFLYSRQFHRTRRTFHLLVNHSQREWDRPPRIHRKDYPTCEKKAPPFSLPATVIPSYPSTNVVWWSRTLYFLAAGGYSSSARCTPSSSLSGLSSERYCSY